MRYRSGSLGKIDTTWNALVNLTNEGGAVDGRTARGQAIRLRPRSMGIGLYSQY